MAPKPVYTSNLGIFHRKDISFRTKTPQEIKENSNFYSQPSMNTDNRLELIKKDR
jgi:hypothetical protein